MKKQNNHTGFTLLELLVVAVIMAILSVVIAQVFFTTLRTNSKTETIQDVKESGDRALDVMSRLIQNARGIDPGSSPCPSSGGIMDKVKLTNFDGGETTLKCVEDAANGVARIASVSASQFVYFTTTNVTLFDQDTLANACTNHALVFVCKSNEGGTPTSIGILFTLRQKNAAASAIQSASATFHTTVTIRN